MDKLWGDALRATLPVSLRLELPEVLNPISCGPCPAACASDTAGKGSLGWMRWPQGLCSPASEPVMLIETHAMTEVAQTLVGTGPITSACRLALARGALSCRLCSAASF